MNRGLAACAVLATVAALDAHQIDPIALQQRAVQRIDAFVDHYRRTGDLQSRIADLAQAEAELRVSNQALAAQGDLKALATGLIKQGSAFRMSGDSDSAVTLYRQAANAARQAGDSVQHADALAWGALAESNRSNLGQAATDAAGAVKLAEQAGDPDVLARALDVLGTVQIQQLDLAAAADTLNREVAIAAKAKDPMTPYFAYLNRSDVYLKLAERCDHQRAFAPCYEAVERSRADLEQALAIVRRLGFTGLERQTQGFFKTLETRRAMIQLEERKHTTLVDAGIFRPRTLSDVLVTERFVAGAGDVPPQLLAIYQQARQEQASSRFPPGGGRTHFTDGMMSEMAGNHDAALASFLQALEELERDRRNLHDDRTRGTFMEDRINFYYAPIQHLLERRQHDQAFALLERSRSRALADLLASRQLALQRPDEQKLFADLMVARTRIADAQGELLEASGNTAAAAAIQKRIRTLDAEHDRIAAQVAADSPRLHALVDSTPASLKAFQQALAEERSEALQYLVLEHALLVWHITPTRVTVKSVFLPRSEVIRKVETLRKTMVNRHTSFDEATARELFLFLVAPVLSEVRAERLVVLPHEDLHYVPFQALLDPADGRFAGERFQFTYAPSASVYLQLRRSPGLGGARLFAIADPSIPAAVDEVAAIAALFPAGSRVVSNTLARERDVKAQVAEFDVLHLAVHGTFNAAEPLLSHLTLGAGAGEDGRLTAAEMFGLPLATSRVVVLSACETARAQATHANEVIGFVRALIYAGAGTLVLSHWKVDSEATRVWMHAFYEAARTRPLADAARAALRAVRAVPEYRHPYYWAAFTMVGR